jgi:hypothetical protein
MVPARFRLLCTLALAVALVGCTHLSPPGERTATKRRTVEYVLKGAKGESISRRYELVEPQTPRSQAMHRVAKPPRFPERRVWRPRRHFGPFHEGSDLSQIQLHMTLFRDAAGSAQGGVSWYFNDFFNTVEDDSKAIFRIYYRTDFTTSPTGVTLPAHLTPATPSTNASHVPGAGGPIAGSTNAWSNDVLFSMTTVRYSSRYGGSVAMDFSLAEIGTPNNSFMHPETFEYEFGKGEYRFDAPAARMSVYVVPAAGDLNPRTQGITLTVPVHVEIEVDDYIAYRNGIPVPSESARSVLDEILVDLATMSAPGLGHMQYRGPAQRFAYAWLHDQHQGIIDPDEKVTQLVLADNVSDVWTERTVPYLYLQWRTWDLDGGERQEEWEVPVVVESVSENGRGTLTEFTIKYDEREGNYFEPSGWKTLAALPVTECEVHFNHVEVTATPTELDPLNDDEFDPVSEALFLLCSEIEAQVAGGTFYGGPVLPRGAMNDHTYRDFLEHGVTRSTQDLTQGDDSERDGFQSEFRVMLTPR